MNLGATLPINLYLQVRDGSTPVINAISVVITSYSIHYTKLYEVFDPLSLEDVWVQKRWERIVLRATRPCRATPIQTQDSGEAFVLGLLGFVPVHLAGRLIDAETNLNPVQRPASSVGVEQLYLHEAKA